MAVEALDLNEFKSNKAASWMEWCGVGALLQFGKLNTLKYPPPSPHTRRNSFRVSDAPLAPADEAPAGVCRRTA